MYQTLKYQGFCDDLLKANHVLIGGATGSGKSVLLNQILYAISAYDPRYCKLIIIDLKKVDFMEWSEFPHVMQFVTESERVNATLDFLLSEMSARYTIMQKNRQKKTAYFPIYCVIDEFAQVLNIPGTLQKIVKLGQLGRAAGIHMILATQDTSKKGIPAQIQQNFTCRVGLKCLDKIASRQVIGIPGCEELPRYGKAIVSNGLDLYKISVPMITEQDIENRLHEVKTYYRTA